MKKKTNSVFNTHMIELFFCDVLAELSLKGPPWNSTRKMFFCLFVCVMKAKELKDLILVYATKVLQKPGLAM